MNDSKIAKGSIIILLGSLIFRVGGFIYRFSMASLLGPAGYGVFTLTLVLIAVLQLSAEGGLPPAIAKYIAQYDAVGQDYMVEQIIKTSFKLVMTLGIILSIVIYIIAEPLALMLFHNPEAVLPFQCVALITPFSVIVGELKGVFQGYYEMNFINVTKAFEQSFTIIFAVLLVMANFYIAGAVIGTAIGYMITGLAAFIIFRKYIWSKLKKRQENKNQTDTTQKLTFKKEMKLVKMLFLFSIPVYLTSLGELFMYDIGTWIIGFYWPSEWVGYYGIGSPIARIPLMISMAVATAVLPATAAALSTENRHLLNTYVNQAFRYVTIVVLPMSLGIAVLANPLLSLLFPGYELGTGALQILAIGMLFFTLYIVSASVAQGIGKPVIPLISLAIAVAIEVGLSWVLVPTYNINGAALATTVATFVLMITVAWGTLKKANTTLEFGNLAKIAISSILMAGILFLIPMTLAYPSFYVNNSLFSTFASNTYVARIFALIFILIITFIGMFIYTAILTMIGGVKKSDVSAFLKLARRLGPLAPTLDKLGNFLLKYAK